MKKKLKHLIDVDIERIRIMYEEQGIKIADIAKELGCNKFLVSSRIKENGFKKKDKYNFITKELLDELYNKQRLSMEDIAKKLKVSAGCIKGRLLKYNFSIYPYGINYKEIPKEELERLYVHEQKSTKEVAKIYGVTDELIRNRLHKYNIEIRGSKNRLGKYKGALKNVSKETLYKMYIEENKTVQEIADFFNTTKGHVSSKLFHFNIKRGNKSDKITKEVLYKLYVEDNLTLKQVGEKIGITSDKVLRRKLKEFGIKPKETKWNKITKEILERLYLKENLIISEISERLNCPRHVITNRLKIFNLFNLKNKDQEEACIARRAERAREACSERSSYEDEILTIYPTLFKNTYEIINAELDLYYPNEEVAIEFNGTFWHSVKATSNDIDVRHVKKCNMCDIAGIQLINIFEYLWKNKNEKIKILNILDNKLRKDKLKEVKGSVEFVPKEKEEEFERKNNILQYKDIVASYTIGTFSKGKLQNSLAFNVKENSIFIERFTTKIGYIEDYKGLIDYLIEVYEPISIEVLCNRLYYNGDIFKALGFKYVGITSPQPTYAYNTRYVDEEEYKKNPLKYKDYNKVYDCGRIKLKLTL